MPNNLLLVGQIAQLIEHCTCIKEVRIQILEQAWNFQAFLSTTYCKYNPQFKHMNTMTCIKITYIKSHFVMFCFFLFFCHNRETSSCSRKVMTQNFLHYVNWFNVTNNFFCEYKIVRSEIKFNFAKGKRFKYCITNHFTWKVFFLLPELQIHYHKSFIIIWILSTIILPVSSSSIKEDLNWLMLGETASVSHLHPIIVLNSICCSSFHIASKVFHIKWLFSHSVDRLVDNEIQGKIDCKSK